MPVLTDRQEPEDYEREPEEPNEYALKYLFRPQRPALELARTGRTLLYSGTAANVLASFMVLVALELVLPWQLLGFGLALVLSSGLAAWQIGRVPTRPGRTGLALLPVVLLLLGLADCLTLNANINEMGLLLYYLPGVVGLGIGTLFIIHSGRV